MGNLILPGLRSEPAALERIDIKEIDDVDVVQRGLHARKEAGPLRFPFRLVEVRASREQSMIGPGVVVGKGPISPEEVCGHAVLTSAMCARTLSHRPSIAI